jgi:hypothetical protein
MKCPYPKCQKDYNDGWPKVYESFVNPKGFGSSIQEQTTLNRIYLITRLCRFCHQYFHEVYIGHSNYDEKPRWQEVEPTLELLISYPCSKTRFETKEVPQNVRDHFNEAERCRSIGSITGTGACLRKAIYSLCDDKQATGDDYREKITNLPVKNTYKELLKHIKWLGDNTTKPGLEVYSKQMVDQALGILPVIIDELYTVDDRIEKATKLLAKARSKNPKE